MNTKRKTRKSFSPRQTARRFRRRSGFVFATCLGIWVPSSGAATVIDLDATQLNLGALPTWNNTGSITGNFVAPAAAVPSVTTVAGVKGVTLNGTSHYYTGPAAPVEMTGGNPRTVEAWIYNPAAADEETIFAWGRRGGPDGSNTSFNHGLNATFGAVGHWGAGPDIGWNGRLNAGRWTYVAYTYDGITAAVYSDGELANSEDMTLDTWAFDNTDAANLLPFRVGSQNDASGVPTGNLRGSMTIAKLKVHDVALDAATLKANYDSNAASFGLGDQDNDGLPSWYENQFASFLNPTDATDAAKDQDADGLTNLQEFQGGTAPDRADTDGDGLSDSAELNRMVAGAAAPTNPLKADTDGDGLADNVETGTGTFVSATDTGSNPLQVDSDTDTFSDFHEVLRGSNPNQAGSVPDPANSTALVSLDASSHGLGPLAQWPNLGALGGAFVAPGNGVPVVQTVQGVKGITFNGTSQYYTGPAAPSFIAGNASRTVEAWILNPVAADEETIFSWGRRGGPDGSNTSFNHGVNATWGAVGHWGSPDIGWNGEIATGQWTYVVYTYDGPTQTTVVYKDGVEVNREELPNPLNTWAVNNAPAASAAPLPFRVASQNEASGTATGGLRGSMTIAKIRVYDRVLTPETIDSNFDAEADAFGVIDTDGDGLPTWFERQFTFLNPQDASDAAKDHDTDGLSNLAEFQGGTSPELADTDGDGVTDGAEVNRAAGATNPLLPDTDQDGLSDKAETGTGTFVNAADSGSDPLAADSDGDGFADGQEAFHSSNPNSGTSTPTFTTPVALVNLDAAALAAGSLSDWPNTGAVGGSFKAAAGSEGIVQAVQGVKGVTLDGVDDQYVGPAAPAFLAGNASRTVDAWIFNPELNTEETVFAWGRRGGPDGSNASFTHGTNPTFGAMGQWGAGPDVGWNGQIVAGQWTHVAYAYDGPTRTATVYKDGVQANTEVMPADLIVFATDNVGDPGRPLPFRVGAQSNADGNPGGQFGSLTVGRVRVYDQALTAQQVMARYDEEKASFTGTTQVSIQNVAYNVATGALTITWTAAPGSSYTVESSGNLRDWVPAATGVTSGTFTEAVPTAAGGKFFRLRVQ